MTDSTNGTEKPVVILDLGKKRRKHIKRLRKGRGKLMRQVDETISQLIEEEEIDADSQIVIVVVKEKPSLKNMWP